MIGNSNDNSTVMYPFKYLFLIYITPANTTQIFPAIRNGINGSLSLSFAFPVIIIIRPARNMIPKPTAHTDKTISYLYNIPISAIEIESPYPIFS